jgi:ABC-type amino acid transport substrate-binding protein
LKFKGENMKKTLVLLLTLAMLISLVACSGAAQVSTAPNTSETVKKDFRVGMECNYAPFNWTQTDNSNGAVAIEGGGFAGGYDVEIAKKIAEGLGMNLVIVKTEWDGLIPALTSGKIDAIIAGMSEREDRKVSIDFTKDYYTSELVIVVKKDSKYASASALADFTDAKITGQINTVHYDVISQIPGVQIQTAMETFPAMIVALESGKIDGYVSERPGAISAQTSNPGLAYVQFAVGKGFTTKPEEVAVAVGIAKGKQELIDEINQILATISKDQRDEIMLQALKNQPLQG